VSNTTLIVVVALITFASRATFLLRPAQSEALSNSRFLSAFPVALFVAIATTGLAAPGGSIAVTPTLWAGVGGIIGALLFRRSVTAVLLVGFGVYWLARLLL
jgi:branched-subunit amino acid transport protein